MFNLYSSFPPNMSLSDSHRENGVSYQWSSGIGTSVIQELREDDGSRAWWDTPFPPMASVKRYDLCFEDVAEAVVSESSQQFEDQLARVQKVGLLAVGPAVGNCTVVAVHSVLHRLLAVCSFRRSFRGNDVPPVSASARHQGNKRT